MTKAGILTYHRASNYGALLQAYALQSAIEKMGCDVEIIDYRCDGVENAHNPVKHILKFGLKGIYHAPYKLLKYIVCDSFRKHRLHLSEEAECKTIAKVENKYSILIAGSDQLWNDRLSEKDKQFFMPNERPLKKYTYAISIGDFYDLQFLKDMLSDYGSNISEISLREKTDQEIITSIINKNCRVDVDPTFLLTKDDWDQISIKPKVEKKYVLIYIVPKPDHLIVKAEKYAKENGYEIVYLNNKSAKQRNLQKNRYSSPEEFLGWLNSAECIFTNSFHGTALSIIMEKPFFVETEYRGHTNKRIINLLNDSGLEDRMIGKENDDRFLTDIDWEKTKMNLNININRSKKYLENILNAN